MTHGVSFPADADGRRSTSRAGRAVVADALRPVDPVGALGAEQETAWRSGYVLHLRRLVEAGVATPEAWLSIAEAGLDAVRRTLVVAADDGSEQPLDSLATRGRGPDAAHPRGGRRGRGADRAGAALPGARLRGDDLRAQLGCGWPAACWSRRPPRPSARSSTTRSGCGSRAGRSPSWAPVRRWARWPPSCAGAPPSPPSTCPARRCGSGCCGPPGPAPAGCWCRADGSGHRRPRRRPAGRGARGRRLAGRPRRSARAGQLPLRRRRHPRPRRGRGRRAGDPPDGRPPGHRAGLPGHPDRRLRRPREAVEHRPAPTASAPAPPSWSVGRCAGRPADGCCTGPTRPPPTRASPTASCRSRAPTTPWPSASSAGGPPSPGATASWCPSTSRPRPGPARSSRTAPWPPPSPARTASASRSSSPTPPTR